MIKISPETCSHNNLGVSCNIVFRSLSNETINQVFISSPHTFSHSSSFEASNSSSNSRFYNPLPSIPSNRVLILLHPSFHTLVRKFRRFRTVFLIVIDRFPHDVRGSEGRDDARPSDDDGSYTLCVVSVYWVWRTVLAEVWFGFGVCETADVSSVFGDDDLEIVSIVSRIREMVGRTVLAI